MASTPSLEYFNSMWQYLPQGHEKPLKQAFYNTVANICLVVATAVVIAVYFILSPFLRPLCWAVLCGTFLYPFKRSLTAVLRHWLKGLHSSGTPLAVGCVILPFQVVFSTAQTLTDGIWTNLKLLLGVIFGLPSIYLIYNFGPLQFILEMIVSTFQFLDNMTGYFSTFWIWTLFVAYVLAVFFLWTPDTQRWLKILSFPMWIALALHVSSTAGPLRVPLLILLLLLMTVGLFMEMSKKKEAMKGDLSSPGTPLFMTLFSSILGEDSGKLEETKPGLEEQVPTAQGEKTQPTTGEGEPPAAVKPTSLVLEKKSMSDTPVTSKEKPATTEKEENQPAEAPQEASSTHQYFMALIWGHVIVRMWMHFWIILLLFLIPFLHMGLKWLWNQFCSEGKLRERLSSGNLPQWLEARKDALVPRSVRGLSHLALKGDSKVISVLEQGLDNTTSILFILMLLVGTLLFSFVAAIQIQRESMYMIKTTQEILNKTMNSEVSQWMPDAEVLRSTMDQVVETTHQYGRNFISSKVKEYVNTNEADQDNLVNQVLEVWDRVYDAWFTKEEDNQTKTTDKPKPFVPVYSDLSTLWQMASKGGDLFQFGSIMPFVKENLGTFMSVLDSVWVVLKGNMSLVLTVITTIFSALLGGGSAILNFVISAVIFLTTLFYLLASSGNVYKPMELFAKMSPEIGGSGSGFGQAVEAAISGVFMASLKMASFYGLYTWLIHLIFGMNIVFIPSALAALFAAIPFLGPYWAAIPAVIELWLVHGQGLNAALLFAAHMLPAYVVDTAIYREIEGGHPYVTGLAIAGGMYGMGLEGALIGPMILCCLIVLVNMYGKMLKNDPATPNAVKVPFRLRPMATRSDKLGQYKTSRSVSSDTVYAH